MNMEWIEAESKEGYYDVFLHENGEKYIVLEGLDPELIRTPSTLESFMLDNYSLFALLYVGVLLATFTYLIGVYLIIPQYVRLRRGLPFFAEQ